MYTTLGSGEMCTGNFFETQLAIELLGTDIVANVSSRIVLYPTYVPDQLPVPSMPNQPPSLGPRAERTIS